MDGWVVRGRLVPALHPFAFFIFSILCLLFFLSVFLLVCLLVGYLERASATKRSEAVAVSFSVVLILRASGGTLPASFL